MSFLAHPPPKLVGAGSDLAEIVASTTCVVTRMEVSVTARAVYFTPLASKTTLEIFSILFSTHLPYHLKLVQIPLEYGVVRVGHW